MRRSLSSIFILSIFLSFSAALSAEEPILLSVQKIWDAGPHNAFTDLIRFQEAWYCCFRESTEHVGGDGKLRVLRSDDGEKWQSVALLTEVGIDLRDPKLSRTPDGRLMMSAGGSVYEGKTLVGRQPRVAFSVDGKTWSPTQRILSEGDWLWRVSWHANKAYGVTYRTTDPGWEIELVTSVDGIHYTSITLLDVSDKPNETTLRFLKDGTMVALARREGGTKKAHIGTSSAPYTDWRWHESEHQVGGPNFVVLPNGQWVAGGRDYNTPRQTKIAWMTANSYEPFLTLPSGGDNSYPGFVWYEGVLWMSYYSSHEGKSSIYLARVAL
jgi:hypothetical protein